MDLEKEKEIIERQPPTEIRGVEYEYLENARLCKPCGRLVLAGQTTIKRTPLGRAFENILPLKHGVCLGCAADGLSEKSVKEYENVLTALQNYETLKEKKEITERDERAMKILERQIETLQEFVEELSDFVEYTEESGVAYYDDQLEDDEDE